MASVELDSSLLQNGEFNENIFCWLIYSWVNELLKTNSSAKPEIQKWPYARLFYK